VNETIDEQGNVGFGEGDIASAFALLAEMTQDFTRELELEPALDRALCLIIAHVDAEAGSLWLLSDDGEELACSASVGPAPIQGMRVSVHKGIIGRSVSENVAQLVLDASADPNFNESVDKESGFETRSVLCAPMSFSDRVFGAIEVVNKRCGTGRFQPEDIHPLKLLASSAALAIANARMAASLVDHERVRRELELAAEIQQNLLPSPRPAPFPLYGMNIPAGIVSGDFFDILPLGDEVIAFCLGDVSGKGMNAAMLMAKTASLFRCLAKAIHKPGELLARLNSEVCETATRGMFVTMAAGVYDSKDGALVLANAGHEPPLLHSSDGGFRDFPANAPPLGILPDATFPEFEIELEGGSLYLCSDGLTEAYSETDGHLGAAGLKELIGRFYTKPPAERLESIVANVRQLELRDDLTLLVLDDRRGLCLDGTSEVVFEQRFAAQPGELKKIRTAVRESMRTCGCNPDRASDVVIAIDEACQNVIRHGYRGDPSGEIVLSIERCGDNFVFTLRDFAPTVDPDQVRPRALDDVRPGGLGTHFIHEVMDECRYVDPPSGEGNLLRMVKRID